MLAWLSSFAANLHLEFTSTFQALWNRFINSLALASDIHLTANCLQKTWDNGTVSFMSFFFPQTLERILTLGYN